MVSVDISVYFILGINKVQLLGRVGNIPKEFQNESRRLVAFPLATVSSFRTRNEDGTGKNRPPSSL